MGEFPLRDLLTFSRDGEWGQDVHGPNTVQMRVVRGTDFDAVRTGDFSDVPRRWIDEKRAIRKTLQPYDILIETAGGSRDRITGRTVLVKPSALEDAPTTCASFSRFLRADASKILPQYLFWFLQNDYCNGDMDLYHLQHTGVARFQFTEYASRTHVLVPDRSTQERVASLLGALDDKIELNSKMNRTVGDLISELFKSWFVDFDPVVAKRDGKAPVGVPSDAFDLFPSYFEDSQLGPIPLEWHIARLGDLAELNACTWSAKDVPSEIRYVEISDVHRGDVDNFTVYARGSEPSRARRVVRDGDTVVSAVRPERGAYFLCLEPPPNLVVSTGFVVLTPHADHRALVYCAATSDDALAYYELHADGGAYPAMRPEAVNNLRLAMPHGDAICECFSSIVNPLLKYAHANRIESGRLADFRDALLPPLLSGEITLKTAEKTVAEVV